MTSNVVTEVAAGAVVKLDRVRKLPGDPKKLRGRVVVAPAAGWVTVTSKNLTRVDASAAPADDREDWEYDPGLLRPLPHQSRRCVAAAKQRAKVAKLLEKEFPTVKLPAAARTSWSVSRMRAFWSRRAPRAGPTRSPASRGGDPAAAQAEYRLAMEGVEREALRAVEGQPGVVQGLGRGPLRGAFLRPELASRVDDCRRALRFASSPGLERWLREGGKPNWDGPRDWLPPNGGWGDPLPSKTENLLGRLKSGTRRVERLDELTGTWHGFRRSYLPGAKPVALRPYDFRTYRHLAASGAATTCCDGAAPCPWSTSRRPTTACCRGSPATRTRRPWEKKPDERWTTLRDFADAHLPGPEAATPYPEVDDAAARALAGRCRHRPCVCQCLSADVDVDDPVFSVFASLPAVPPHFEAPTQHLPYQPTNRMATHLAKCKPPILLAAHLQSDDDKTEYESSTDDGEWQPEYDTRLETPDALYPGRFELHVLPALGGERLSQRGGAAWHVLVHGRVRWCLLPPNGGRYVKRRYHELQRAPPKPAASCRHQDFVSGLDWFRSEFETLADPAARRSRRSSRRPARRSGSPRAGAPRGWR
ncbi:protein-disulfide reductase [Aureococcus anophagefferens]|nr:protein-disulfide reductase [Aureococcus anophagefferens]